MSGKTRRVRGRGQGFGGGRTSTYSEDLAAAVCERLADGVTLTAVGREAGMPGVTTIKRWMRARADFALRLQAARAAGGGPGKGGRPAMYTPELAMAVCEGLIAGHSLTRLCERPGMPSINTVFKWLRDIPDFLDDYDRARVIQGHGCFDEIGEIARRVTPETVGVARVQLYAQRVRAAALVPWKYSRKAEAKEPYEFVLKHYSVVQELSDGSKLRVPQRGEPGFEAWEAAKKARGAAFHAAYVAECRALEAAGVTENVSSIATARAVLALKLAWEEGE